MHDVCEHGLGSVSVSNLGSRPSCSLSHELDKFVRAFVYQITSRRAHIREGTFRSQESGVVIWPPQTGRSRARSNGAWPSSGMGPLQLLQ